MKNNKKIIGYALVIMMSVFLGSVGTYFLFKKFPLDVGNIVNVSKLEKEVTITDEGIADAVDKVMDAVVIVNTYSNNKGIASGTGFVYKIDGDTAYILTNHHVIESGDKVNVVFTNNSVVETKVVGSDKYADIAVLSLKANEVLSVAEIGSSSDSRVGDTVFAVGAPLDSAYSWTVTRGIVSGKDRMVAVSLSKNSTADWIMKVMQTDAAINSGNSGGPLSNSNGQVIGVNSMKLISSGVEGMGFAIPIEDAIDYANQLIMGGALNRPLLGVSLIELWDIDSQYQVGISVDSSIEFGVIVADAEKSGPAGVAGMKIGDVITHINDVKIDSLATLRYELFKHKAGDKITIKYIRDGSEKNATVTLKSAT